MNTPLKRLASPAQKTDRGPRAEEIELLDQLENAADADEVRLAREEAARGEVVEWERVKAEFGQ